MLYSGWPSSASVGSVLFWYSTPTKNDAWWSITLNCGTTRGRRKQVSPAPHMRDRRLYAGRESISKLKCFRACWHYVFSLSTLARYRLTFQSSTIRVYSFMQSSSSLADNENSIVSTRLGRAKGSR